MSLHVHSHLISSEVLPASVDATHIRPHMTPPPTSKLSFSSVAVLLRLYAPMGPLFRIHPLRPQISMHMLPPCVEASTHIANVVSEPRQPGNVYV